MYHTFQWIRSLRFLCGYGQHVENDTFRLPHGRKAFRDEVAGWGSGDQMYSEYVSGGLTIYHRNQSNRIFHEKSRIKKKKEKTRGRIATNVSLQWYEGSRVWWRIIAQFVRVSVVRVNFTAKNSRALTWCITFHQRYIFVFCLFFLSSANINVTSNMNRTFHHQFVGATAP